MNGDEVCRRVRESNAGRDIPIILMSGVVTAPDEIEALKRELRIRTFLTKPFPSEALYVQIMTTLQARATLLAASPPPAGEPRPAAAPPPETPRAPALPQAIKGDLEKTPFEQILLYLMLKRGTGSLTVERGSVKRRIAFIDGAAVELDLPPADDDFGHYLASKNLINAAELRAYEERRVKAGPDPRDLFIKMGCLTPHRFQDENRNFLHDRLIECFSWRTGSVLFEWGPSVARTFPAAEAFMPSIFYQGFRAHLTVDAAVVLYTLDYLRLLSYGTGPKRSDLAPPFPIRERKQRQPEREAETFEDLGDELSELAEEIEQLEILPEPATAAGEAGGLSDLEERLKHQWETIRDKNYYEIFGMTAKTFSFEKLKQAYFELSRTYGPEKFFASTGEVMELAEEFLSRISNAYTTLSDVVSKENYDDILASKVPTGEEEK
jgi:hypothetical protein